MEHGGSVCRRHEKFSAAILEFFRTMGVRKKPPTEGALWGRCEVLEEELERLEGWWSFICQSSVSAMCLLSCISLPGSGQETSAWCVRHGLDRLHAE